jgi:hypothetical protein
MAITLSTEFLFQRAHHIVQIKSCNFSKTCLGKNSILDYVTCESRIWEEGIKTTVTDSDNVVLHSQNKSSIKQMLLMK